MQLQAAFSVPFGVTRLQNTEEFNNELSEFLLANEGKKNANKSRNSTHLDEVFESTFDLFNWQDPKIKKLKDMCLSHVFGFVTKLSNMTSAEASSLKIYADAWYHVTRNGGYFTAHNHPNSSWAAVYCVKTGNKDKSYKENAVLRFLDFKAAASMYLDPTNSRLPPPFNIGNRVFDLVQGDLVIFPSYLLHEVSPFWGEGERITVAMNCWFKDKNIEYPG